MEEEAVEETEIALMNLYECDILKSDGGFVCLHITARPLFFIMQKSIGFFLKYSLNSKPISHNITFKPILF